MQETSSLPVFAGIGPSLYLELPAIVAGALSGGAHAVRKGFDVVGVAVLAVVTGLGGGILRDVLLGHLPPLALAKPTYLATALVSAAIACVAAPLIARGAKLLALVDAASLGFFGTVGAQQGLAANLPIASVVTIGALTAVGGGVLRDVLANDTPSMLAPGTLYVTVATMGVLLYVAIDHWLGAPRMWAEGAAVGFTVLLRHVATWRDWHGPLPLRRDSLPREES